MTRRSYRFGDHILDVDARRLLSAGRPVQVPAKVFDCLVYLVQHRGRAIGHDELVAAVWGKTEISESLLRQTIRRVRSVLDEDGSPQSVLRTIPGFGYQFAAEVAVEDRQDGRPGLDGADPHSARAATPAGDRSAVGDTPARSPTRWRGWRTAIGVIVLAAAVTAGGFGFDRWTARTPAAGTPSLEAAAVLPVAVNTADPTWSWVRLGLMDLLATRLRSGGQLVVPSESVVALARGDAANDGSDAIRAGTGARYLVVPSARRTDKDWVVRLELREADGATRDVEARNADLVIAGRRAADQLLALLGKALPVDQADTADAQADELLARIKSALLRDDVDSARALIDGAPAQLQRSPELRFLHADMDVRSGRFDEAQRRLESLLAEAGAEEAPVLRARVLNGLGLIAIRKEQPAHAIAPLDEAIALLGERNEPEVLGNAYNTRGMAHSRLSQYDLANADFARSRLASEIAGNMRLLTLIDTNEGLLAISRNQPAAALPLFEQAAARSERLGILNSFALASAYTIWIHLALLEPERALALYEAASPKVDGLQNPTGVFTIAFSGAIALQGNGRLSEARAQLDRLAGHAQDTVTKGVVRGQQAQLEFERRQLQPALIFAQEAVDLLVMPDDATTRAQAWLVVVRALRELERPGDAAAALTRFAAWAEGIDSASVHVLARLGQAEQAWSDRRYDEAIGYYEDALRTAIGEAVPADIAIVVTSYGTALIGNDRLDRASAVIGQVARWSEHDFACAVAQARLYRALGQREAWQLAIDRARRLAGERSLPAGVATYPPEPTIGTPGAGR